MKRYRFVLLVLLILTLSATGCRRRCQLFGRRGARCAQPVYIQPQTVPTAKVICPTCPTVCPDDCPVVASEIYGGEVISEPAISEGGVVEPYDGASLSPGHTYRNLAPTLPDPAAGLGGLGQHVYGRPMFQVVGDRRLDPSETMPDLEGEATAPIKSDNTAQVPK